MNLRTSHEDTQSGATGKTPWVRRGLLVLTSLLVLGMAVGAGLHFASAAPAPWVSLPQSVAPQISSASVTGSASDTQRLTLGVTLQSKNEASLKAYALDVAKPKSKVFHQYLTPKQFAQYFGADAAKLDAVEKYFQSQGLHLDGAASGGLFLQFTGNVAQVNAALHTHINTYRGADGRAFYANASALQLPSALAPSIINVAGTENARQSHPAGLTAAAHNGANVAKSSTKRPSVTRPNVTVTCPTAPTFSGAAAPYTATGLLPTQLNKVYNFQNTTNPGNNQWAAFVEMDGFSLADLAQYANCVGISSTIQSAITGSASSSTPFIITQNVTGGLGNVLSQTGQNFGTPLTTGTNAQAVEEELEITLGLVPNITHITVMQTSNTTLGIQTALSAVANENAAQVVGYQWGMCEADVGFSNASAEQQLFMQMALQGQTVLAATGNNGLYACSGDGNNFRQTTFSVQDPASNPFVTAVGGTKLGLSTNVGATAAWAAEEPWSNSPTTIAAGGGGISQFWAAPSWQQSANAAVTTTLGGLTGVRTLYNPNTTTNSNVAARVIPDVSAVADTTNTNIGIYCSVGTCTSGTTVFTNVGGTTAAEAIWTAATIEANQTTGATLPSVGGRIGLLTPALYSAYQNDTTAGAGTTTLNNLTGVGTTAFCDFAKQLGAAAVATTASTAVGTGLVTVVPGSMNGILAGMKVNITGAPGAADNGLTVSAVTATSFQATIAAAHNAGGTITPTFTDTANAGPVAFGPGIASVAVAGTANLIVGQYVLVDAGAASEIVTVSAITDATHFTATFLKGHTGGNAVVGTLVNATSVAAGLTQTTTTLTYEVGAAGNTAVTPASMTNITTGSTIAVAAPGAESVTATVPVGANYFVATFVSTHLVNVALTAGGHVASASGVSFGYTCAAGSNFILNNSIPLSNGAGTYVTTYFPYSVTYQYQQPPTTTTLMYGKDAGFAVKGAYGTASISGYNALTGLGSPNVGQTNATSGQLATYLLLQARYAASRVYMVAQGLSDNKYWIASYGTNPYVPNMASSTAWYAMNTVNFSGAPVIVDDANAAPGNLFILGPAMPTGSGVALYQWNIATATATQVTLAGGNLPGAYAGSTTSCSSISAATDGTSGARAGNIGVYCVTSSGALYATKIALAYNGSGQFTGATISNWTNSPLLNTVGYAPQVSSDNNGNYLVLETNTGGAGVYYQYFAGVGGAGIAFNSTAAIALFPSAAGAASGLSPFSFAAPLATTCLTTPSAAYVAASNTFAAACTASDTKQMWANVFYPPNTTGAAALPTGKFNATWTLLGQPSSSVTFMPGNAVAVDNYAADQSYGQLFYIAEGSDKAMYLNVTNAMASNFLGKMTGWQSVSLPGIFNTNSAADFVDA